MTVPTPHRIPCPRCGTPVTGAFKFCPACAYRLKPAETPVTGPARTRDRWPYVVLSLLLGMLAIAILLVGIQLFTEPTEVPTLPPENGGGRKGAYTVHGDLLGLMVHLQPGTAMFWPLPDPPDPEDPYIAVRVGAFRILKYEVPRSMYAEFVTSCDAAPEEVPEFLRNLWRPKATGNAKDDAALLDYANDYIDRWWTEVARHLEDVHGHVVERPADLRASFEHPLPEHYGSIILVPPPWVYLTGFEEFRWKLPEGTENLPVTNVSWYDAAGFAEWAKKQLNADLRLPAEMEWLRAGSGGDPDHLRRFPWGDMPYRYACNSFNTWGDHDVPRLLRVDYRYSDALGKTPEGVWAMSGNAREWTCASELIRYTEYFTIDVKEENRLEAPTCGGSFREGIDDCAVEYDSIDYLDKRGRWDDVGFRLWMPGTWMGG